MQRYLYLDVETVSTVNVVERGVYAHAEDDTLDITMAAWAVGNEPVTLWTEVPVGGTTSLPPEELEDLLRDPDVLIWAHNAAYERLVIAAVWDIVVPLHRWRDSAAVARWYNLPGSLDGLSNYLLGAKAAKLKISPAVKALWATASLPWTFADMPAFDEMGVYCVRDVEAMRDCIRMLPRLPAVVWQEYAVAEAINDRGCLIDTDFVEAVVPLRAVIDDEIQHDLAQAMGSNIPDARVSPRSTAVKEWATARVATHVGGDQLLRDGQFKRAFKVRRRDGVGFYSEVKPTFDKPMRAAVRTFLEEAQDHAALDVLDLVDEGQNAAITKYDAVAKRVSADGRLRGMYMFSGASQTHRASSTGVQTHNLLRATLDLETDYALRRDIRAVEGPSALLATLPPDMRQAGLGKALSMALRSTIRAATDHDLVWCDWSAIEARVLPWLAGDEQKLRMFEDGVDVYRANARYLFSLATDADVSKDRRQVGKVQELALGFGGGKGAFAAMSRGYGVKLPEALVAQAVRSWREVNPVIVRFWRLLERAAFDAMRESNWRKPQRAGKIQYIFAPDIAFGSLMAVMPDGGMLVYPRASIEQVTRFEDQPPEAAICFDHPVFGRTALWHGILVENVTQAVAASLLRDAMVRLEAAGLQTVCQTHDEIVIEAHHSRSGGLEAQMVEMMCQPPAWATGLPLAAEAGSGSRYKIEDAAY